MVAKGMIAVAKAVCCPRDTMHSIPSDNRGRQCDVRVTTRWRLSLLLL